MLGFNGFGELDIRKMHFVSDYGNEKLSIMLFLACFVLVFFVKNSMYWAGKIKPNKIYFTATLIMLIIAVLSLNTVSEFLYFQF